MKRCVLTPRGYGHLNLSGLDNVSRRQRGPAKRWLGWWRFITT